jgi:hypothetical protein
LRHAQRTALAIFGGLALAASPAAAEPMFLSKQYARCTTCHYSPTGGGLLTPYGRSLSREELSTTGRSPEGQGHPGEERFLFGALGGALGPFDAGIELRPSRLHVDFGTLSVNRSFFMNADVIAAFRRDGWTLYGELGREPLEGGAQIASYEYWLGYQSPKGPGFRVGRFMPAYGLRVADHTALTRFPFFFDVYDQVYALELSHTGDRHLVQLSVGPGLANAILNDNGRQAFTATGRAQFDLGPRSVLVVSGLFRNASRLETRNGAAGLAFGLAPTSSLSLWAEADAQVKAGASGVPAYTLLGEAGFEAYRGIWLKFSPQLRTEYGRPSSGQVRLAFEADLLPRTHWNVDVSFYRDKARASGRVTKTLLAQLHLYL